MNDKISARPMAAPRVSFEALRHFIEALFASEGLPHEDALKVAALMAQADLQGSDGHGVIRLPQYLRRLRAGGINKQPDIRVVQDRAATALVDGNNGMGHLVVSYAVQIAIDKARSCGVGWVGTRMSNHAGPASLYTRQVLEADMVSIYFAVGSANHMPPWGGQEMLLSTNPISAGVPAGSEPPVVLDMATTVAAYGKVKAKAKRGEMMPEGWMIDLQGKPLLDPNRSGEGFLLPIGGHKGYGLALVIGLLAGTLNGAAMGRDVIDFNSDDSSVANTGQSILVIDPAAFGDRGAFKGSVDTLLRDIRASERLPEVERIWLPGEQSLEKSGRYAVDGIPIPVTLLDELNQLAGQAGLPPLKSESTT
jgi:L-2-hydroxycarboxylate dehydrogenase (NAD+)